MEEEIENERLLRKRRRQEADDDAPYVPSPEHVTESQSTPKVRRKAGGRKKATPKIRVSKKPQRIVQKKQPEKDSQKPPTPPHETAPPQSPIHQSPQKQPTPPQQSSPPRLPTPPNQPSPTPQSTPPLPQPFVTSQDIFGTPPLTQVQPGSSSRENKRLAAENKKIADREKLLAVRVQKLESENKELAKKVDADQTEIDILKVRVSELEEEKNRRDDQNEYFKLKNKELVAAKALSDHEVYMLNRVVESMLGTSVNQRFEELKVEDLRAERQAELERQMKDKGKGVEGSSSVPEMALVPSMVTENPEPISAVSGLFEEETPMHELIGDDDEEDDEDDDDDDEFVYSASSHSSKGDDHDDAAGGSGVSVTEAATEKVVDDLMNDTVNEESGEASGKGESGKTQIVEHSEQLFLRLDVYREMLKDVNPEISFDFEEDLESFDINKQQDYKYDYVEEADQYDRVEVEECSDSEDVAEDTSKFPTLMEFFAAENREELRQKVTEVVNENVFENLKKDAEKESQSNVEKEDRSKWFKDSHERKFKRPLKYFQCGRIVSQEASEVEASSS
ncbi:microtubule-associated protein RP/EB family member 1-like [Helianthus annuus]|uniref:microtubule-associated protein RP/EB family member 1-like n=1 Tax=Helianthus annuus TaxID=4232 RepID=UPI000B905900|nr:microtubule-associated protein RP/EB family member 1-like [Helianthus annuus]